MSIPHDRWIVGAVSVLLVLLGLPSSRASASECAAFDATGFASGCGSVQVTPAVVRGGDTLTVEVNAGEDPNGPCAVGGHRVSVSYALPEVLLDGEPVTALSEQEWPFGDAGTYDYGDGSPDPVPGATVQIPGGHHTLVFTISPEARTECVVRAPDFGGRSVLRGPWVVLSRNGGYWSTPVPFATECIGACGDGTVDARCEDCDPPGGSCNDVCQCTNTCGDGVLEAPCEQCDAPGPSCNDACQCTNVCGNGVVEPPCEQCDLGARNGGAGSGCTAECRVTGVCASSGATCGSAADCVGGGACLGNAIVESGEECDDGNRLNLDCCSARGRIEPSGSPGWCDDGAPCTDRSDCTAGPCHRNCRPQKCSALGPHMVALSGRLVAARDPNDPSLPSGRLSALVSSAKFSLRSPQAFDPASQSFQSFVTDGDVFLWSSWLRPEFCAPASSCFAPPTRTRCPRAWRFFDPENEVFFGGDLLVARLKRLGRADGRCKRKVRVELATHPDAYIKAPTNPTLRHTVVVGDLCASTLLTCTGDPQQAIECSSADR